MPVSHLACSPISSECFGHEPDFLAAVGLPKVSAAAHAALGHSHSEAFSSFLESRPVSSLAPTTSFKELFIKFTPRDPAPQMTEMTCENDLAVCNRECERLFGDQEAEMEEPCKLAVAQEFGKRGLCFPGTASVQERRRGTIHIGDVRIGDELVGAGGEHSRVVALLHNKADTAEVYLQIHYRRRDTSSGRLTISPGHLVCSRQGACFDAEANWDWIPAENVRPGNELEDENGEPAVVESVNRACCLGAFAPMTAAGDLTVDGILCSCYAPPVELRLSHSSCHAAMLPLRLLDSTKLAVENWTRPKGSKEPLLTVDALWLLPGMNDKSIHPWASGLLRTAIVAQTAATNCKAYLPSVSFKSEPRLVS